MYRSWNCVSLNYCLQQFLSCLGSDRNEWFVCFMSELCSVNMKLMGGGFLLRNILLIKFSLVVEIKQKRDQLDISATPSTDFTIVASLC